METEQLQEDVAFELKISACSTEHSLDHCLNQAWLRQRALAGSLCLKQAWLRHRAFTGTK